MVEGTASNDRDTARLGLEQSWLGGLLGATTFIVVCWRLSSIFPCLSYMWMPGDGVRHICNGISS